MLWRLTLRLPLTLAVACFLSACASTPLGSSGARGAGQSGLTVVTSTTVLADLIRNVVGNDVEVISLVPVGGSPYYYEPSPQDAITLSKATVFFANGHHYEDFARKLLENSQSSSRREVMLSEGLRTLRSEINHGDHEHRFVNPTLYLDVRNAMAYVETIRDTMVAVDAPNAERYRARAQAYLAELEQLDGWIIDQVAQVPQANRKLMKDQDSFIYYAERYGFQNYAASYEGTQEAAPSASQYAALIDEVKKNRITVMFGEEGFGSKLLGQLAQDTGARLVPGLYAATIGTTEHTDTYLSMMRWNTQRIVEHLQ
jgi:manganese/iron transport system substrate-binding protein